MVSACMSVMVRVKPFFIEFSDTYIHGDNWFESGKEDEPPLTLFLHGSAPRENRKEFDLLRQLLVDYHGLSSCAFDFVGHGSTGGEWPGTSLQQRVAQAQDVIDATFDCQPFNIVAIGNSSYAALQLLEVAQDACMQIADGENSTRVN